MKNNKAQIAGVGIFVMAAVAVIVGLVMLQSSAQNIGGVINTVSVANTSLATVVNGTPQYLTGYTYITDVVVYNETGNVIVGAGNYTVTNNFVYNGQEVVKITPDATAGWKSAWKVSGTARPQGYANDAGSRAVAGIIILLAAIAIAIYLLPMIRQDY